MLLIVWITRLENADNASEYIYNINLMTQHNYYELIDMTSILLEKDNLLKYFDDMKIEDISYVLNTPENTVKSHLKRAKESLSSILKEGI